MVIYRCIIFLILIISNLVYADDNCVTTKEAFLLGDKKISGKIAVIDTCNQKIVKVIKEGGREIDFHDAISKSEDKKTLSQAIIYEAMVKLSEIQREFKEYCTDGKCNGIIGYDLAQATTNKNIFFDYIKKVQKIDIMELSNSENIKIGFLSVYANKKDLDVKNNPVVIINVSDRYLTISKFFNNEAEQYSYDYGPKILKEKMLKKLKRQADDSTNNLSHEQSNLLLDVSKYDAISVFGDDLPKIRKLVDDRTKVYVIGGALPRTINYIVGLKTESYNRIVFLNTITKLIDRDDSFIINNFNIKNKDVSDTTSDIMFLYQVLKLMNVGNVLTIIHGSIIDGALVYKP